jgi:hypothetical protein
MLTTSHAIGTRGQSRLIWADQRALRSSNGLRQFPMSWSKTSKLAVCRSWTWVIPIGRGHSRLRANWSLQSAARLRRDVAQGMARKRLLFSSSEDWRSAWVSRPTRTHRTGILPEIAFVTTAHEKAAYSIDQAKAKLEIKVCKKDIHVCPSEVCDAGNRIPIVSLM